MNLLFHRYGNICEPDILECFAKFGLQVIEDDMEIYKKNISPRTRLEILLNIVESQTISFVFSINFFPYISDFCEKIGIPYVCWSTDSPVLELFSASVKNRCNRIFLFDYAQYLQIFHYNPDSVFYLPLCTNVERWNLALSDISQKISDKYSCDISFVGSLYTESSPLRRLSLPNSVADELETFLHTSIQPQDAEYLEQYLNSETISYFKETPNFPCIPAPMENIDAYIVASYYLEAELTARERTGLLDSLSQLYPVRLYSHSDTSALPNIQNLGGISTHKEMPFVFRHSKINLNITSRSIRSGIPLRVWDVLGCGGFLLTNYQEELTEYFDSGVDLDYFSSVEELVEKTEFYLKNDTLRNKIAQSGYEKVKTYHTYECRLGQILKCLLT